MILPLPMTARRPLLRRRVRMQECWALCVQVSLMPNTVCIPWEEMSITSHKAFRRCGKDSFDGADQQCKQGMLSVFWLLIQVTRIGSHN